MKSPTEKLLKHLGWKEDEPKVISTVLIPPDLRPKLAEFDRSIDEKLEKIDSLTNTAQEIMQELDELHEKIWSTVNVKMGLSTSRYKMRYDKEVTKIEVLEDKWATGQKKDEKGE